MNSAANRTFAEKFGGEKPLIGDEKDLKSDVGDLSREEMKERLFVAEKVMKTLFKRNKELEEFQIISSSGNHPQNLECTKCSNDSQNQDLKDKVAELEKQLERMRTEALATQNSGSEP